MAIQDPKQLKAEREAKGWTDEGGGGPDRLREEGKFLLGVVGWEFFKSSGKGTPGVMIRFVVLEGPRTGAIIDVDFWLTDKARQSLGALALANNHEDPFDDESNEGLEQVFPADVANAVQGTVKAETYNKQDGTVGTSYKVAFFNKYKGAKKEEEWKPIMEEALVGWDKYGEWRQKNPRKAPGSGGGSGGGGGGGQTAAAQRQNAPAGQVDNDDIPF